MKKTLLFLTAVFALALSLSAAVRAEVSDFGVLPVVFVASEPRGDGSGSSAENALGNAEGYADLVKGKDPGAYKKNALYLGFEKIASTGGTVVICGELTLDSADAFRDSPAEFKLPKSDSERGIRITSVYGGTDHRSENGARLIIDQAACQSINLSFNAKALIENVTIGYVYDVGTTWYSGENATVFIEFGGYSSEIGEGVETLSLPKEGAAGERYPLLLAGRRYSDVQQTDLTVRSGKWQAVIAGCHGMVTDKVNYPAVVKGNARLSVFGGEIEMLCGEGYTDYRCEKSRINGRLDVYIGPDATVRFADGSPTAGIKTNKHLVYDVRSINPRAIVNFETAEQTGEGAPPEFHEYSVSYRIENGFAVITKIESHSDSDILVIPDKVDGYEVKKIAGDFVYIGPKLKSLSIPEGVETIGAGAFSGSDRLVSALLPSTLKEIGDGAFGKCYELLDLFIPSGCESIGENVFDGCVDLFVTTDAQGVPEQYARKQNIPVFITSDTGDANFDGKVSLLDVIRLKKYLAGYDPETLTSNVTVGTGADSNGNGSITSADVIRLKRHFASYDLLTGNYEVALGKTDSHQPQGFTFDPKDYTSVTAFPPPEGDKRKTVVDYMLSMANVEWTPSEDFNIGWKGTARFGINLRFKAGTKYLGLPYSETTSSLDMFEQFVYGGKFKDKTYYYEEIVGNNCSQSMILSYQQLVDIPVVSKPTKPTEARKGLLELPVDRRGRPILKDPTHCGYDENWTTTELFKCNSKESVMKAYAACDAGDILYLSITGTGHTRMVDKVVYERDANGNIDPARSYILTIEQTNAWDKERPGVNSTWWIDHKYTFATLYSKNFYPVTLNTFHEDTPLETAYILYNGKNSPDTAVIRLNGTVSSNFPLTYLLLTLKDSEGRTVSFAKAYRNDFTQFYSADLEDYREELFNGVAKGTYTFTARAGIARGGVDLESFEVTVE